MLDDHPLLPNFRTYDDHLSSDLADRLTGTYNLMGMDHMHRLSRIKALTCLYAAVLELGDFEHTSDWDWRITVMYAPHADGTGMGLTAGTYEVDEDLDNEVWADEMRLPYKVEPNDYATSFSRWVNLEITEFRGTTDEPHPVSVPIDRIRTITIEAL